MFTVLCLISLPIRASSVIWQGVPEHQPTEAVSGELVVEMQNNTVTGKISSLQAKSSVTNGEFNLVFKDPENALRVLGEFRAYVTSQGDIHGHWVQPKLVRRTNAQFATPVRLQQNGARYVGTVTPLNDGISVFFKATEAQSNRYRLSVFTPENNGGRYYRNTELVFDGNQARIVQQSENGEQVLAYGSHDVEKNTFSFNFPYWGGKYNFKKISNDSHEMLAFDEAPQYVQPETLNDGWTTGDIAQSGIVLSEVIAFVKERQQSPPQTPHEAQLQALLIAQHGKLIFEQYFRGFKRDEAHDLRSASKSLTGILPGLVEYARNEGRDGKTSSFQSSILETPIYQTLGYPTDVDSKNGILLKHALSMSTGLDCDDNNYESPGNEENLQNQIAQPDWYTYILDQHLLHTPGEVNLYCSAGINLAGAIASAKAGHWIPRIIDDLFARPLNIDLYHANLQPNGDQAYSGGGLYLRGRDFLKLGQLMLDGGIWNNQRLLSEDYVEAVLSVHGEMFGQGYGLGWWIREYPVGDKSYTAYYASGNGGQQVFIVPELGLTVAFLNSAFNTQGSRIAREDWFPNWVLARMVK
ncbi:serine hydrolase domain-containing protein [Ningiella sp. W23]|uniref:serine hydrolase domain-containing protein n=1 Tax=Ningiella sp. W23 TaxID=3023715 RepID=UPI00375630DE